MKINKKIFLNLKELESILANIFVYLIAFLFIVNSVYAIQPVVDLKTAENFVILSKSGISTTGTTSIIGDIGVSPIDSTAITGFGLIIDSSNEFAKSSLVTGNIYAADYAVPTPSIMTTAILDMETAYEDIAGRTLPDVTELGAGDISGMTISPGLYKWGTGVLINNGITLSGSSTDVWIFQISQDLTVGNGAIITLSGGAQAKNIFWQVGGQATLGTTSQFKGNILSKTQVEMQTGATLDGRALTQTAVTLNANKVVFPGISKPDTISPLEIDSNIDDQNNNEIYCSSKWECTQWSTCSNNIQTRECTDKWNCGEIAGKPDEEKSCNSIIIQEPPIKIIEEPTNQEIISEPIKEQTRESKEEIKSGNYNTSYGDSLNVRELGEGIKELKVNGILAQTNLSINAQTDSLGKTKFKIILKNGQEREIMVMPDVASQKALDNIGLKVCSPYNNCSIELKVITNNKIEKIQYQIQLDRHSKLFGIFEKKMHITIDVDAETGETVVHKPWWAFMATEKKE